MIAASKLLIPSWADPPAHTMEKPEDLTEL